MTSPQENPNRRSSARVALGLPARLWIESGWQRVCCDDVSETGAGVVHAKRELRDLLVFPKDRRKPVRLSLTLPDGVLEVEAKLVHRGTNRLGLRFLSLGDEARTRLQRYCAEA